MPFDVRGRTRATMVGTASSDAARPVRRPRGEAGDAVTRAERPGRSEKPRSRSGQRLAIVSLERGIPSRRGSSSRVDCVPALCTHRPSLLPIERPSEVVRSAGASTVAPRRGWRAFGREGDRTRALRGSKSRNKVSVGEPAEGSSQRCRPFASRVCVDRSHGPGRRQAAIERARTRSRGPRLG